MAWKVRRNNLQMCEGDYGIALPIVISGVTFGSSDVVRISFKKNMNSTEILHFDFTNIQQNTVNLQFTEAQSALFPVGSYVYGMDWYQNNVFLCNLIPTATFKVVDKA